MPMTKSGFGKRKIHRRLQSLLSLSIWMAFRVCVGRTCSMFIRMERFFRCLFIYSSTIFRGLFDRKYFHSSAVSYLQNDPFAKSKMPYVVCVFWHFSFSFALLLSVAVFNCTHPVCSIRLQTNNIVDQFNFEFRVCFSVWKRCQRTFAVHCFRGIK